MRLNESSLSKMEASFRSLQEEIVKSPIVTDTLASKMKAIQSEIFQAERYTK